MGAPWMDAPRMGQQAHSPGQSVAAPRESNIDNPRALQGQKHEKHTIHKL